MSLSPIVAIPSRVSLTLAADLVAADLVKRTICDGLTLLGAEISPRRLAYRPGWGVVWVTDWVIRWRDAAGSATITTIERHSDDETSVSAVVELLARAHT